MPLCQHAKRAVFHARHCWGKCLEVSQQLPSLSEWDWVSGPTQAWEPLWATIPQASENCQDLLKSSWRARKDAPNDGSAFAQSCLVPPIAIVDSFVAGVNMQPFKGLANGPCKNTQNLRKNYVESRNLRFFNESSDSRSLFFPICDCLGVTIT